MGIIHPESQCGGGGGGSLNYTFAALNAPDTPNATITTDKDSVPLTILATSTILFFLDAIPNDAVSLNLQDIGVSNIASHANGSITFIDDYAEGVELGIIWSDPA